MYKLVPAEATDQMLEAIRDVCLNTSIGGGNGWLDYARKIYDTAIETAPNPWRPIAEAEEIEDVLAWPVNGRVGIVWFEDGSRPSKYPRGWHERDTYREVPAPTHFIPLEWLGKPEARSVVRSRPHQPKETSHEF